MFSPRRKGLRPLSFWAVCLSVHQAVSAQILPPSRVDTHASRDIGVWSEYELPAAAAPTNDPVDEAEFSAVSKGGPWSVSDWRPLTPAQQALFQAARNDRWGEVFEQIRSQDPEPDARDADGATLLTLAARRGRGEVVRELLRRGADPDRRGLHGQTPLGAAAVGGHDLVVQDLLRAGADPSRWDAQGQAPLHLAAREGHPRVIRTLVAAGARPLAWNAQGQHALAAAAGSGHIPSMAALVELGLAPGAPDEQGLNALHAAAVNRHFEAVDWLRKQGVSLPHPLTQVLIDRPADPLPVVP